MVGFPDAPKPRLTVVDVTKWIATVVQLSPAVRH